MKPRAPRTIKRRLFNLAACTMILSILFSPVAPAAFAQTTATHPQAQVLRPEDTTYQSLPFSQNWTNTALITVDDNWSGVAGIMGYRGDNDASSITGVDPQTLLGPDSPGVLDVNANKTDPNPFTTGGVSEFELTDPVVAMQGSGTADAPYLLIFIDTTGLVDIQVAYNVRDVDSNADNAVQQVALHYRVGTSGNFTNVPAAYIADASIANAVQSTPVSVTLPDDVENQSQVQLRIMTTNAVGSDEWVGIDDISITGSTPVDNPPEVSSTVPADAATGVSLTTNITVNFSEDVTTSSSAFALSCGGATKTFAFSGSGASYTLDPDSKLPLDTDCTLTVTASGVTDLDGTADAMVSDFSATFHTTADEPPSVSSTSPLNNATNVAVASDITVTFSEDVTAPATAFGISCDSTVQTFALTGSGASYTLNPDANLPFSKLCTVTITASQVSDLDGTADAMVSDYSWSFTTTYDPDAVTPISTARAAGAGWIGTIQGNLTLDTRLFATRDSFAIQDATGGLYIYPAFDYVAPAMDLGDVVKVKGTVKNYGGLLEMDPVSSVTWISTGTAPDPLATATGSVASTQGKLIVVEGTVTLPTTPPAPGAAHYSFTINDGSGQLAVYNYKLTNIDMRSFASGQQMRIIGISMAYSNLPQLQPRYQTDIVDLRPPEVSSTVPVADATGVSPYRPVSATFNKAMDPDTLDEGSFTLTPGPVAGTVGYDSSTHTVVLTPTAALSPQTLYTAELSTAVEDANGVPLDTDYSWSFTTGDLDLLAPVILTRSPEKDAVDVSISSQIVVTFSEELAAGSQSLDHFSLTGPSGAVPVTFSYDPDTFAVTLTPDDDLEYGTDYSVTVDGDITDIAGNPLGEDDVWTFTTGAEPPMQVFWGDIHNHTSISDGSGTPAEALAAGKAAGLDFMAISDHSYAISDSEWQTTLDAVNSATNADFVAMRGFEYTQGAEGHINVYNTQYHATRTKVTGCTYCNFTPNLEAGVTVQGFYPWLVITGTNGIDSAGTLAQFNHPGWINFNDWAYHPEVEPTMRLEEVGNGYSTSYTFSEEEFKRSLDYGWKLGATNNSDTHDANWGLNTDHRTGVLMTELTKSALLNALRLRRTFASEDKNYSLVMKANDAWMGSEIANTGSIQFHIQGSDPDGELTTRVQIITDQGEVAAETTPNSSSFTWEPLLTITTGVHYYYVKAVTADGDRMVSSPVWTMGSEDVSITDLTIQPSLPTTNNPSLLTVRVTNRVASVRTVSVSIDVDGTSIAPAAQVDVPANGDVYANFSWQPDETGAALVTASLLNTPAGDNPDDNTSQLELSVTDALLPLILIDASHGNLNAEGLEMRYFIDDLSAHGYNVLKNLDGVTPADLNPDVVKLLLITAPETAYTEDEQSAIADYVAAGGSLWLCGISDYTGSTPWAATANDRLNAILAHIETHVASNINMRMNDDEVIDGNNNNGYVFGVTWSDFPAAADTGIGLNVEHITSWSLNSLRGRAVNEPLTASTPDVQIVIQGDLDEGYTSDTWKNPFHTSNTDADSAGDAYIYNPTWVYPATKPVDAIPVPMAAVTDLPDQGGRIMLYGDSSDAFTMFAYTAGDGKQNELFNLEATMWLLGEPLEKSTIAEARAQTVEDQPNNLDRLVWVEGKITAAYNEFFNVLYVQDDTGGITVHAPAGDIDPSAFTRGTTVRVVGTVGIYNGDTELEFFEAEMVQVITPSAGEVDPLPLTALQASDEDYEGWLTTITGVVVGKSGNDTLIITDGTGTIRVFLDGYNGVFDDIQLFDRVRVVGLVSEDGSGARIRVRNYKAHVQYADDVEILDTFTLILPLVWKS